MLRSSFLPSLLWFCGLTALVAFLTLLLSPPTVLSCSEHPDSRPSSRPMTQASQASRPTTQAFQASSRPRGQAVWPSPPASQPTQQERAYRLMKRHGCFLCHSTDGTDGVGPTIKGIYGKDALMADGTKRKRDEAFLRQKILRSDTLELAGDRNVMPQYEGALSPRELDDILAYLRTLR